MSLALTLNPPVSATVGRELIITGTGFTNAGNVELNIFGVGQALSVKPILVASGGGAITTVGAVKIIPWRAGKLRVEAKDITAGTKVSAFVRVSAGS